MLKHISSSHTVLMIQSKQSRGQRTPAITSRPRAWHSIRISLHQPPTPHPPIPPAPRA